MTRAQFRQHLPALREQCARQGLFLAWGNRSFTECQANVMAVAMQLGAYRLNNRDLAALEAWISDELSRAAAKHSIAASVHQAAIDRTFDQDDAYKAEWHAHQVGNEWKAA